MRVSSRGVSVVYSIGAVRAGSLLTANPACCQDVNKVGLSSGLEPYRTISIHSADRPSPCSSLTSSWRYP